jgi:tRNA (cmo5U34)-methyltransferase
MKIPADWSFDSAEVAAGFDTHVRAHLPWYDLMTGALTLVARHFIPERGLVYDIGASTGNVGRALAPTLAARQAKLIALDTSPAMIRQYRGPGRVLQADARTYPFRSADLIVCALVLMFIPPADRAALVAKLLASLKPGGALLLVDKEDAPPGYIGTVLRRLTWAAKAEAGECAADILAKDLSLAGLQRPIPPDLRSGGQGVAWAEWFRYGEFGGWVGVKGD